jgi:hypothetical protein
MTHEECCNVILWAPALIDLDIRTTPGMGLPDLPFPVAHSRIETLAVQSNQPYFFALLDLLALRSLKITTNLESLYMRSCSLFLPIPPFAEILFRRTRDIPGIICSMTRLTELALWNSSGWLKYDVLQMLNREYVSDILPDLQAVAIVLQFVFHPFKPHVIAEQGMRVLDSRSVAREGLARLRAFRLKSTPRNNIQIKCDAEAPGSLLLEG